MKSGLLKLPKAVLGLAYKGGVDDTRESQTIKVIEVLKSNGEIRAIQVAIYDPHVKYSDYELSSFETVFKDTDLIAILTAHKEFKYTDTEEVINLVRKPVILDTKNFVNTKKWMDFGFEVLNISGSKSFWS